VNVKSMIGQGCSVLVSRQGEDRRVYILSSKSLPASLPRALLWPLLRPLPGLVSSLILTVLFSLAGTMGTGNLRWAPSPACMISLMRKPLC
jgi:hypothetical protein